MTEQQQLEQAIAAQETLRGTLPDAVVDATIAALREKLAALEQAPRDEQRKLVTVLFADLAGWTAMSERMDAEEVREIQQAYFAAVTPPILQRGGRVEKYIGDAILAVFGVPCARGNGPGKRRTRRPRHAAGHDRPESPPCRVVRSNFSAPLCSGLRFSTSDPLTL